MAKKTKQQDIEIIEEDSNEEVSKNNANNRKITLTLFLFLLPVLVIAFTNEFITKCLLFFYLAVLLVNFIRDKASTD